MKRNIIEITECGTVIIPDRDIRMSEAELVSLFGVIAPTVRTAIRAVYKSGILVYCLEMVVALAFHIRSYGAERVRNAILERLCLRKEKTSIFFSLGGRMETIKYQA